MTNQDPTQVGLPASPAPQLIDTNADGIADQYAIDAGGNGVVERWDFDANQDGKVEQIAHDVTADGKADYWNIDTDGDGYLNQVAADSNRDGRADTWYIDTNQDGEYETVTLDTDGNGVDDTIVQTVAPEVNTNLGNIDLSTGNVDPTLYNDSDLFDTVENTFHNPIVDSTSGDWRYEENDGDGVANGVDNFPDDITRY